MPTVAVASMKCVMGWGQELCCPVGKKQSAAASLPAWVIYYLAVLLPRLQEAALPHQWQAEAKLCREKMLPAPAVWLMLHHLLWRVRQGEWQAFEEPINPMCKGSWR